MQHDGMSEAEMPYYVVDEETSLQVDESPEEIPVGLKDDGYDRAPPQENENNPEAPGQPPSGEEYYDYNSQILEELMILGERHGEKNRRTLMREWLNEWRLMQINNASPETKLKWFQGIKSTYGDRPIANQSCHHELHLFETDREAAPYKGSYPKNSPEMECCTK